MNDDIIVCVLRGIRVRLKPTFIYYLFPDENKNQLTRTNEIPLNLSQFFFFIFVSHE